MIMFFSLYSIPLELRDGEYKFSECKMYDRNYTDIIRFLDSRTPMDLSRHGSQYVSVADAFDTKECSSGWNYDRRAFPNTVVMEVSSCSSNSDFLLHGPTRI